MVRVLWWLSWGPDHPGMQSSEGGQGGGDRDRGSLLGA